MVYQIYPKSFYDSDGDGFGDLNGIREKLSYLEKLGVDVIWLNPIYESPQVDNGYDISNYKKIEPQLGTMEDFDMLLKEAHEKGLASFWILLSIIHRTNSPWFTEAKKGKKIHIMIITYGKIRSRITGDRKLWRNLHGSM